MFMVFIESQRNTPNRAVKRNCTALLKAGCTLVPPRFLVAGALSYQFGARLQLLTNVKFRHFERRFSAFRSTDRAPGTGVPSRDPRPSPAQNPWENLFTHSSSYRMSVDLNPLFPRSGEGIIKVSPGLSLAFLHCV